MNNSDAELAAETITRGIGRRRFVQAVAALSAGAGVVGTASCASSTGEGSESTASVGEILQPGGGSMPGDHYLSSEADQVLWGYVPTVHAQSVLQMRSGQTVTIDAVSHEGILEDQGRNPVEYFGGSRCRRKPTYLRDAVDIASGYRPHPAQLRHRRSTHRHRSDLRRGRPPGDVSQDRDSRSHPTRPVRRGVEPPRQGALGLTAEKRAPAGSARRGDAAPGHRRAEAKDPAKYGNVSTFTAVEDGHGVMPFGNAAVRFPLAALHGDDGRRLRDAPA